MGEFFCDVPNQGTYPSDSEEFEESIYLSEEFDFKLKLPFQLENNRLSALGRRGALARHGGLGTCTRTTWAVGQLGSRSTPPHACGSSRLGLYPKELLQRLSAL